MLKHIGLLFHFLVILLLTFLTQIGGLAWLIALFFKRRVIVFTLTYLVLWCLAFFAAPYFGRTPVACWSEGPLKVQSWFYCIANRTYMKPELLTLIQEAAQKVDQKFPGTTTLLLDANFPFLSGFPLLPHLSHDDGEKADIAFFYSDRNGYRDGVTPSPLGYFAYEEGPSQCPQTPLSLRRDFNALQSLWKDYELEPKRTALLINTLAKDHEIGKIFLEPHLKQRLDLKSPKIRFQGCKAARHDDHIHIQLTQ